jgi:hypothetical protein
MPPIPPMAANGFGYYYAAPPVAAVSVPVVEELELDAVAPGI